MIGRVLEKIENVTAPLWQWCAGFAGILFIRFFFENLSSPTLSFPAVPDTATLVHYTLFYIGIFITFSLILRIFIPDLVKVTKFLFFGFPIIWLPPIVDLILSRGAGYRIAYAFPSNIFSFFATALWPGAYSPFGGVTPGLHAELVAILIGVFAYVLIRTSGGAAGMRLAKSILAAFLTYCAWVFWMAFPAITNITPLLSLPHIFQNLIPSNVLPSYAHAVEVAFNGGLSTIFYLFDFLLVVLWIAILDLQLMKTFARNLRPGRLTYYISLMAIGALVAARAATLSPFANWIDVASLFVLALSFACAFEFAVVVNDLADIKIDAMSNSARPLPSGALDVHAFNAAALFFFAWSLAGAFVAGFWPFFAVLVFTAAYYIYSAPPLRLKRIPLVSSFLISIASLSAVMAGFYFIDANKLVPDFPMRLAVLIIVCITLAVNFKDIKDVAGDAADNIWTIPVLFGEERGKQITGGLLAASFLAVPPIAGSWLLFLPSLAAAALGYWFVAAKKYREWRIFTLYFIYLAVVGLLLWL